jgi:hypothetical protein
MVTTKHLRHSRDTDHFIIHDEVERRLIFDCSSDCCCTGDEAQELMEPSSSWGPPQQHARKGAVEWSPGEVRSDDAGVKSIYVHQADNKKKRYAH